VHVATFGDGADQPGAKLTFDAGQFMIDGQGPVTVEEIVESDRMGELVWPYDGMRAWVLSQAGAPPAVPFPPESATTDGASAALVPAGAASFILPGPDWIASCPVCHGGSLLEGEPRSSFWGKPLPPDQLCPRCQARFVSKDDGYELRGAGAEGAGMVERFRKQALTSVQWARITAGGKSDAEIAMDDLKLFLDTVCSGNARIAMNDDAPVALKRGEDIVAVCFGVTLRESRTVSSGVYGGPRVKVSDRVSLNLGGFRSAPHEEMTDVDSGDFVLTTARYIFMGGKRTSTANLSVIAAVEPYDDAVAVHRSNKQRMEMFCGFGGQQFSFNVEGRDHAAALNGVVLAYLIDGLVAAGEDATAPTRGTRSRARVPAGGAAPRAGSTIDELESLARLHAAGALTDEEFAAFKAKLLGE